jgi:hypothetical protein
MPFASLKLSIHPAGMVMPGAMGSPMAETCRNPAHRDAGRWKEG